MILTTPRLELRLQTPPEVLAWVASLPPEVRSEISPEWLQRIRNAAEPDPWSCTFRILTRSDLMEIGACGFKAAPDQDGMVEIAYGIDEPHRNQGFATEAASALVDYALSRSEVTLVRANTKKGNAPSERTLLKCGFASIGEFEDPEDGLVSRWEIRRQTHHGRTPRHSDDGRP